MTAFRRSFGMMCVGTSIVILAGCAATKENPPQARGWVGGEYKLVDKFPKLPIQSPKAAVLVTALATNTPARVAGLREGDLILSLDHQPVTRLTKFRWKIDACKPGTVLPVTAYRDGQTVDYNVVVGRETYRTVGAFSIGFPFVAHNIWMPYPGANARDVSLVVLGYKLEGLKRKELGSVANAYDRKCDPKSEIYDQDYDFWVAVFELTKGKGIVTQEMVAASN